MKQVCACFICVRLFYEEKLFMTPFCYKSVYRANFLLDHLFRFIAVNETYIIFNHLFSTFLVKQLVPLCYRWENSFIFLFYITFCKKSIMAPMCIGQFMRPFFTCSFNLNMVYGTNTLLVHLCST